jgi:hypothetical protein
MSLSSLQSQEAGVLVPTRGTHPLKQRENDGPMHAIA